MKKLKPTMLLAISLAMLAHASGVSKEGLNAPGLSPTISPKLALLAQDDAKQDDAKIDDAKGKQTSPFLAKSPSDVRSLDKVIVSATGFSETANASIRNNTVINTEDIDDKGYQNLEQVLKRNAEITFVDQGLGPSIDMRGQGKKSNIAVKVLVDGNPINFLDGAEGVTPLSTIDLNNVEQVEIIAGGGAVLYGNGTRGGVINIITKQPRKDSFHAALQGSGFLMAKNFSGQVNAGVTKANEHVAASLDFTYLNDDGYQEGSNNTGYFVKAQLGLFFNEQNSLTFTGNFAHLFTKGGVYVTKELADRGDHRDPGNSKQELTTTRPSFDIHYLFDGEKTDVDVSAFYHQQEGFFNLRELEKPDNKKPNKMTKEYGTGSYLTDEMAGLKAKVKYNYNEKGFLIAGYDYMYQETYRHADNGVPIMNNVMHMLMNVEMSKQSHSLFIMNQNTFKDFFTLSLGARYEYSYYDGHRVTDPPGKIPAKSYDAPFQDSHDYAVEITPSFAFHDKGLAYFKYERGFITPYPAQFTNKNEKNKQYYDSGIKPETYDTFELGVKDYFHKGSFDADIKATLYYTWTHDEIMHMFTGKKSAIDGWKYYNLDSTGRLGLELSSTQSYKQISFTEALSYIYATILKGADKGKVIPNVPKLKVTGNITYTPLDNLSIYTDMSYTYGSKDVVYAHIKDYFLMDLGVAYEVRGFTIAGGFHNITNAYYYTYQDSKAGLYSVGNGASAFAELRYRY